MVAESVDVLKDHGTGEGEPYTHNSHISLAFESVDF